MIPKTLRDLATLTKNLIVKLVFIIHSRYYYYRFRNSKIVIFDIDNTICDTWPLFLNTKLSNKERWQSVTPYESITKLLLSYHLEEFEVIYLTARPWSSYFTTKRWLKKFNLPFKNVITTLRAENKIYFLRVLKQDYSYYDDLSHNAERGQVKFYMDVINFVKQKKNITYYGFDYLLRLQKGEE